MVEVQHWQSQITAFAAGLTFVIAYLWLTDPDRRSSRSHSSNRMPSSAPQWASAPQPASQPRPKQPPRIRTGKWEFLLISGPNLNLLGKREPEIYGRQTLEGVVTRIAAFAAQFNANVDHFQSNSEGKIVERIHNAMGKIDFIIINPGGLTHTSVALRDALLGVGIPFHEVHLSNIHAREPFRHHSYISDRAQGVIRGFGVDGYELAVMSAFKTLEGHQHITFPDLLQSSGQLTPGDKNAKADIKQCHLLVLDGPNFELKNFGSIREDKCETLQDDRQSVKDVVAHLQAVVKQVNVRISHFQSNEEGTIIDRVHAAMGEIDSIVINPGALSHTSVALRDALLGSSIPFFEVHLCNTHAQEKFRQHSFLSDKAVGVVSGIGFDGYDLATLAAIKHIRRDVITVPPIPMAPLGRSGNATA